jgi:hypothetical protein
MNDRAYALVSTIRVSGPPYPETMEPFSGVYWCEPPNTACGSCRAPSSNGHAIIGGRVCCDTGILECPSCGFQVRRPATAAEIGEIEALEKMHEKKVAESIRSIVLRHWPLERGLPAEPETLEVLVADLERILL